MSSGYQAVQWNRRKVAYDAVALAGIVIYIGIFLLIINDVEPPKDLPAAIDLRIRAFGSCAFVLLTVILAIGPLARLNPRFLPLLYNRRHLGVMTFLVASCHVAFMLDWYVALKALPNLPDELSRWGDYAQFIGFPFKALGIAAYLVLFLMAATSHDFWLAMLTPRAWKALHMALYGAYGLVVLHVSLGSMQSERSLLIPLRRGTAYRGRLARARPRERHRRRLGYSRASAVDSRQSGAHRCGAGWRTDCGFS
jgi:DMSO/TMAO reductase YedYZ heme-binding membrane subunit